MHVRLEVAETCSDWPIIQDDQKFKNSLGLSSDGFILGKMTSCSEASVSFWLSAEVTEWSQPKEFCYRHTFLPD